jgi:hypothetical protein
VRILVPSCRKYADAWEPFLRLLDAAWPSRPPVVMASDDAGGVALPSLRPGDSLLALDASRTASWCEVMRRGLDAMEDEFILLMQEDFFVHHVQPERVAEALAFIAGRPSVGCFRVYPCPGADGVPDGEWFGPLGRSAPYLVSCQSAIWRTGVLRRLLADLASFVPHATAADFELRGTPVMRTYPDEAWSTATGVYVVDYLCSAITRGEWTRDAVKYCAAVGLDITTTGRPIMAE